ncbi:MAG: site-2 protease family protein [Clostridia bacterium]|nr:site-2 protease family protein [Clostridia bacterium]
MLLTLIQTLINKNSYSTDDLKMIVAEVLLAIPIILLTLSVHETAHGYVANKLGDPTAKSLGRLTLNPFKHFDTLGFLMMMLVGYGWAKPVPINTRYFKNPKRDMAICAAAGPISNLLMAILFAGLYKVFFLAISTVTISSMMMYNVIRLTSMFFSLGVSINVTLAIFNLIPIPPFDGSRIALAFLPSHVYFKIQRYERYIFIVFFVLLLTGILDPVLYFLRSKVTNLIFLIFGL